MTERGRVIGRVHDVIIDATATDDVWTTSVTIEIVTVGTGWRIAHFQNTPAAFHGRPEAADALTAELRAVLAAGK